MRGRGCEDGAGGCEGGGGKGGGGEARVWISLGSLWFHGRVKSGAVVRDGSRLHPLRCLAKPADRT